MASKATTSQLQMQMVHPIDIRVKDLEEAMVKGRNLKETTVTITFCIAYHTLHILISIALSKMDLIMAI